MKSPENNEGAVSNAIHLTGHLNDYEHIAELLGARMEPSVRKACEFTTKAALKTAHQNGI